MEKTVQLLDVYLPSDDVVVREIVGEYEETENEIKEDVVNFVGELVKRNILVKV